MQKLEMTDYLVLIFYFTIASGLAIWKYYEKKTVKKINTLWIIDKSVIVQKNSARQLIVTLSNVFKKI